MLLNDNIVDMEKPDGICSSYFLLMTQDLQRALQHCKNLYFHILFYEIQVFFCSQIMRIIQAIKVTIIF